MSPLARWARLVYEFSGMRSSESLVSGWGRQFVPGVELRPEDLHRAPRAPLFRGLGRSYGDSSLPPSSQPLVVSTVRADRILAFDEVTGMLRAEAGLSLKALNRTFLPKGFFVPVTPGTQFVTLGGMVAADVHGKNHHVDGCFGSHVRRLSIEVADGRIVECGPDLERELFLATVGGMGLTGHILEVEFPLSRIPTPWIYQESERVPDVDTYVRKLKEAAHEWPMTVGWIDCLSRGSSLGRGILLKGRWARGDEAPANFPTEWPDVRVPFTMPEAVLGRLSVQAFNFGLYWSHFAKQKSGIVDPFRYFYPLDFIKDWNLGYGRRGLTQYQCVLPDAAGPDAARRFLELLTSRGGASFLCVIKDCGPQSAALLSFPMPGISIALDIAVRDDTQQLIDALNEFVIAEGGRIYLAKDAFTRREHFERMEPRLAEFQRVRRVWDPTLRFKSRQSIRLFGDAP
ncbi:MAG: FAD-binding oxidoreductase [Myxococcaceae bacterium]|nr:FAD-binding oxidoreductase [Myxococcaceae bacterium]